MERKKLIHSVGSIAEVYFVSNNKHKYTGILKGSDNALLRWSIAKKPSASPPNMAPGIAIKFFRDNVESANIFAMYSLSGAESFNPFEHDLTNHVPMLDVKKVGLDLKLLLRAFKKASSWPTMIGLSNLCGWD